MEEVLTFPVVALLYVCGILAVVCGAQALKLRAYREHFADVSVHLKEAARMLEQADAEVRARPRVRAVGSDLQAQRPQA